MTSHPRAYVICSNPRSGTTLLCHMLRDAGAGQPDSFFSGRFIGSWAQDWNLEWPADVTDLRFQRRYLDAMITEGRGNSTIFGLRLMAENLMEATDWLARCHPDHNSPTALFNAAFGETRFIHLSRQDKLDEAVSLIRAHQSGLWHNNADGSVLEQFDPSGPVHYDPALIASEIQVLKDHDARWDEWFERAQISPLRLTYEELAPAPQAILSQVLDYIGADKTKAADVTPATARLSDDVSREWIERYQRDHSG